MRSIRWKKTCFVLMLLLLCAEIIMPACASEGLIQVSASQNAMTAGDKEPSLSVKGGMAPIDFSETAVEKAWVTEEEFSAAFDAEEGQLAVYEGVSGNTVSDNTLSANSATVLPEGVTVYATLEDAAEYLRSRMINRQELVTICVAGNKDAALKSVTQIMNKVYEYDINGKPDAGDYLYWHMRAWQWTNPKKNSDGTYTIRFGFTYRTDADEERFVTRKVNAIVKNLNLKSSSLNEYQKVRAIYDYIMSIISYDTYHYETNQSYNYMYTAYAALDSGYAVCQSYATLFYRLCEESGISARVICGNDDESGSPTHGWNIVKIGSYYYNVDATWDDSDIPTHVFFLKNMNDFAGHQRNARNSGTAFDKKFPTAAVSYPTPELDSASKLCDFANISESITLLDQSTYSVSADGKSKIILFVNMAEENSSAWLKCFYALWAVNSGKHEALIVDIYPSYDKYPSGTKERIMDGIISMTSTPWLYHYSSDYENGIRCRNSYAALTGKTAESKCSVAFVDAGNRLRYFGVGGDAIAALNDVVATAETASYGSVSGTVAKQTKNNEVKLTWSPYGGASSYMVYRRLGNGSYYCVGTTSSTVFTDEITPKYKYTYRVLALRDGADVAASAEVAVQTRVKLLKKGKTYTVGGYKYKVLKSTSKTKMVAFAGLSDKKLTKVLIPDTVTIEGMKYKVTEISAKALQNNKKVKTVSIGANVTKIGNKAFYKAGRLANVVIKTKKLKSVGSNALSGISGKAEIRVPSARVSKYKKLFAGKGQKASVKIKK